MCKGSDALKVITTALGLANGATSVAADINERQYHKVEAEKTLSDGNRHDLQFQLDQSYQKLHSATDIAQSFNKTCYNVFQTLKKINENNTQ